MKKTLSSLLILGLALTGISGCSSAQETATVATEVTTTEASETTVGETTEATTSETSETTSGETSAEVVANDGLTAGYYKGEDGYLELNEDGTGVMNINGYDWAISWDDKVITDEEDIVGRTAEYVYKDGHLSFGFEGGDGFYTYEYDFCPDGKPEA